MFQTLKNGLLNRRALSRLLALALVVALAITLSPAITPPAAEAAGGAQRPFPQAAHTNLNRITPTGITQDAMNQDILNRFVQSLPHFVVEPNTASQANGFRMALVNTTGTGVGFTVCEVMGYGMVMLAYLAGSEDTNVNGQPMRQHLFNNLPAATRSALGNNANNVTFQTYFDAMFRTMRQFPANNWTAATGARSASYLMSWTLNESAGNWSTVSGVSIATDGALDMTYALILADRQWGGPAHGQTNRWIGALSPGNATVNDSFYLYWARGAIHELRNTAVNPTRNTLLLGNWATGAAQNLSRPSDFMLTHMRAFNQVGTPGSWDAVINATNAAVNTTAHATTGLMSDFIFHNGSTWIHGIGTGTGFSEPPHQYTLNSQNACRVPWRLGLDVLLNGTSVPVNAAVQRMHNHQISRGVWGNIRGGALAGTEPNQTWNFHGIQFRAPYLLAASVYGPADRFRDGWFDARNHPMNEWEILYGAYINILSMIAASGNWWCPTTDGGTVDPVYSLVTVNNGSGGGTFRDGTQVTITAGTPPAGQVFDRWDVTGATIPNTTPATFTMPRNAVTATALFRTDGGGQPGDPFFELSGTTMTIRFPANRVPADANGIGVNFSGGDLNFTSRFDGAAGVVSSLGSITFPAGSGGTSFASQTFDTNPDPWSTPPGQPATVLPANFLWVTPADGSVSFATNGGGSWVDTRPAGAPPGLGGDNWAAWQHSALPLTNPNVAGNVEIVITSIQGATGTASIAFTQFGNSSHQYPANITEGLSWTVSGSDPPAITTQPSNQSVIAGQNATFTVAASGAPSFQWETSTNGGVSWANVPGATSATLSFTAAQAQNGHQFRAVATNANGSVTSTAATLVVQAPPASAVDVQTTSLTFAAITVGGPQPAAQNITVRNIGTLPVTVNAGVAGSGFTVTPSSLTIAAGATQNFSARPNAGLAAGTYNATVNLTGAGIQGLPENVSLSFTVNPEQQVIPPANRALIFPYFFSASPCTRACNAGTKCTGAAEDTCTANFWMGFNQIIEPASPHSARYTDFDITRPGVHTLTIGPWWRPGTMWVNGNANLFLLTPENRPAGALPVFLESVAVGPIGNQQNRITNEIFWDGGSFWNAVANSNLGFHLPVSTGAGTTQVPGFNMANWGVGPNIAFPNGIAIDPWARAGECPAMGTIEFGDFVTFTIRVGGAERPDFGDVDGSGAINANDITLLRNFIASSDRDNFNLSGFNRANADADGNGFINSADVTALRRYLAPTIPGATLGNFFIEVGGGRTWPTRNYAEFPDPDPRNYQRLVALTYDDGPHLNWTRQILDEFLRFPDSFGVTPKASFYVVGQKINAQTVPLMDRMIQEGHSIENHSWDHWEPTGRWGTQYQQISRTNRAIFDAVGVMPMSFRAPRFEFANWPRTTTNWGDMPGSTTLAFHHAWVDTDDWRGEPGGGQNVRSTDRHNTVANVVRGITAGNGNQSTQDGTVVLMHDDGGNGVFARQHVVDAIPRFVRQMQNEGWGFVTVPQMHQFKNYTPPATSIHNYSIPGSHGWNGSQGWLPALPLPSPIDSWTQSTH